jgi:uncharacterized membrane protein
MSACKTFGRRSPPAVHPGPPLTRGAALADKVAETVGSWRFIIIQSVLLGVWIILNLVAFINHWDPYPFILLNLVLSFQAAYAAPIIMMSQNRQSEVDRSHAEHDYKINVKAELEIELLHNKIDALREREIFQLIGIIQRLSAHLAPEFVAAIESEAMPAPSKPAKVVIFVEMVLFGPSSRSARLCDPNLAQ